MTTDDWIRCFQPAPQSRARLVCLPHAGGSASYFRPFTQGFDPSSLEVLAVQYPGRQDRRRDPCVPSVEGLAEQTAEALTPWLDKPLALFGHSMGALVGFELARRLEARGAELLVLFASGRRAPSRRRPENIHRRDDAGIIAEIKYLGGTNAKLLDDPEIVEMIMPAIRGDYTAVETYKCPPEVAISTSIVALTGADDPRASLPEVRAWSEHTTGEFDLRVYPGGHFYLEHQRTELINEVADRLLRGDRRKRAIYS